MAQALQICIFAVADDDTSMDNNHALLHYASLCAAVERHADAAVPLRRQSCVTHGTVSQSVPSLTPSLCFLKFVDKNMLH